MISEDIDTTIYTTLKHIHVDKQGSLLAEVHVTIDNKYVIVCQSYTGTGSIIDAYKNDLKSIRESPLMSRMYLADPLHVFSTFSLGGEEGSIVYTMLDCVTH